MEGMPMKDPMTMMAHEHYARYRWVQAVVSMLALWLISSPFALGYHSIALTISDVASGVVALLFVVLALGRERGWASWANAATAFWLLAAPLVFWAPDPSAYFNDTMVGAMIIAFSVLVPMGMQMEGPDVPKGWSYNPSSWPQRAPIIALSLISFLAARYMATRQLGYIPHAWDPFFRDGTERVLHSNVSRAWPISDAGLGALTYLLEVLMGFMGDKRRWRTMPWMVAGFGFVVVPLGIVSIALVIMQPLVVGAWCSLCLLTAALMLLMIPLAIDEVVAMLQFIAQQRKTGVTIWHTFWFGGNLPDDLPAWEPRREETWRPRGMLWGFTATWNLYLCAALGVWLMFAPAVFHSSGHMADSDHLVGALVIVVAVVAMAEVARPGRFFNLPLAVWLVVATWFLDGASIMARINSAVGGLAVLLLSLPFGSLRDDYGSYNRWVTWSPLGRAVAERTK